MHAAGKAGDSQPSGLGAVSVEFIFCLPVGFLQAL